MKHIFGPVVSRRLKRSLGVDLVPFKTCTLDCAYCECGLTDNQTLEIKEWVSTNEVIAELKDWLCANEPPDYITLAGSGEPTLHSGIGVIIDFIKDNYPAVKVAILTNTTLCHLDEVINRIKRADLILPSLDAVSEDVFQKINRPLPGLSAALVIEGLSKLVSNFTGELWLEIFLSDGINNTDEELFKLSKVVSDLGIKTVNINSLDRPAALPWVKLLTPDQLAHAASWFDNAIIITRGQSSVSSLRPKDLTGAIIASLRRRPQTAEDLSSSLGVDVPEITSIVEKFIASGHIHKQTVNGLIFYGF